MKTTALWTAAVVAAVASSPALAQALNLRVVSRGCSVSLSSGQSQGIAANTDVSNGYQISVTHPRGASATSTLGVSRGSAAYVLTLHDRTSYYAAAHVAPFVSSHLDVSLAAPRTGRVRLDVTCNWQLGGNPTQFGAVGSLSLGAQTLLRFGAYSGSGTASEVLDIGPSPIVLRLDGDTGLSWPADIRWTLRLTPVPPCTVTPYGPSCGADLVVVDDLLQFSRPDLRLLVNGGQTPGLLIAGFQRRSVPVGPCTLLNEALVALPFGGQINLLPPSIPGFSFKLQGAALSAGQLVASVGLDFVCQ
jgi:hypothetical protein